MNGRTIAGFASFALRRAAVGEVSSPLMVDNTPAIDGLLNAITLSGNTPSVTDSFSLCSEIYSCTTKIQNSVCSVPLVFYEANGKPQKRKPKNPAYLFSNANPEDTGYELIEDIIGSLLLPGTAYVFIDYERTPVPQSLWCLDPNRVDPVRAENGPLVDHYDVKVGNGKTIPVPAWQMLRIPMYSIDGGFEGLGPVGVLRVAYTTQRNSELWLDQFYKKGAQFSGILTTPHTVLPAEEPRFMRMVRAKFLGGLRSAWEPAILPKDIKFERTGLTLEDMKFIETAKLTNQKIYRAFHIPAGLMDNDKASFAESSVSTDTLNYWQDAIIPLLMRIEARITERLLLDLVHQGEFGAGLSCKFDLSQVMALNQVKLKMLYEGFQATGGTPTMSVNDARRMAGVPISPKPEHEEIPERRQNAVPVAGDEDEDKDQKDKKDASRGGAHGSAATRARPALAESPIEAMFAVVEEPKQLPAQAAEARRSRQDARMASQHRVMAVGVRSLGRQLETRVVDKVRRIFDRSTQYLDEETARINRLVATIDGAELLQATPADRRLIRRYMKRVVENVGAQELADLSLNVGFNARSMRVAQWLDARSDIMIVGTTRTTRRLLTNSLIEGVRQNESPAELVARVREVIRARYAGQENTIVRTESVSSWNFGAVEAYEQAEEQFPGLIEGKTWITARDEIVRGTDPKDRFSHVDADEQTVELDEAFEVSGEFLLFPGDHSQGASPGSTINCRCTVAAKVSQARLDRARLQCETMLTGKLEPTIDSAATVVPLEEVFR